MDQPWAPEQSISSEAACKIIDKQFPMLKPASAKVLGEGFDNSVFLVNDRYVFRFPRREIAVPLVQMETRLLSALAAKLPIAVPAPEFQGVPEGDYPWPFAGYQLIPGQLPSELTDDQRLQSAVPFANFLRTLHSVPTKKEEELGIPYDIHGRLAIDKRKPMFEENIKKAKQMGLIDQTIVLRLQEFAQSVSNEIHAEKPALVHGDLHIRNFLVNETGVVSGVIDWGDAHIGNPAIDLSIAYSFIPSEGRSLFFDVYGEIDTQTRTLARFKALYTSLLLLLYGHDTGDLDCVRESRHAINLALRD